MCVVETVIAVKVAVAIFKVASGVLSTHGTAVVTANGIAAQGAAAVTAHGIAAHGAAVATVTAAAHGAVHVTTAHAAMAGGAATLAIASRTNGGRAFAESFSRLIHVANCQVENGSRPALTGGDLDKIANSVARNSVAELRAAGILAEEDTAEISYLTQRLREERRSHGYF
jgi:hypothetical protein